MHSLDLSAIRIHAFAKIAKPQPVGDDSSVVNLSDTPISSGQGRPVDNTTKTAVDNTTSSNGTGSPTVAVISVDPEIAIQDIQARIELEKERKRLAQLELEIAQLRSEEKMEQTYSLHDANARMQQQREEITARRSSHVWQWLKRILIILLSLLLILLISLMLFRLYRWTVETPLIKEVVKQVEVEVPIEKLVEKVVEKNVIPEECSQIRRNGKIFINCDGKSINGTPTLGDESINNIPELLE